MKRTDADGHDSNRYTVGNPSLGVPATVVGAVEMNNIQEEIANVVEAAGLTVDQTGVTEDQLLDAIDILIASGGSAQVSQAIVNNQVAPLAITGLLFASASVKAARITFDAFREDASDKDGEMGDLFVTHNPTDGWRITKQSFFDDVGMTFTIDGSGQVFYTSTNYPGGSYAGTFRATVTRIKQ